MPLHLRVQVGSPLPATLPPPVPGQDRSTGEPRRAGRPVSASPACPARHCWVAGAADRLGEKRPGLLLEWRRLPSGWQGRVAYAARLRDGSWALVEEWLPADDLAPADG